jgi:hypothetical protein
VTSQHDQESSTDGFTASDLLAVLWANLVDMMGTAAAASVLRRAVKRACLRLPELEELQIVRQGWEYSCETPPSWVHSHPSEVPAFAEMLRNDLYPILRELTGPIVLRRLERVPQLAELGLHAPEES